MSDIPQRSRPFADRLAIDSIVTRAANYGSKRVCVSVEWKTGKFERMPQKSVGLIAALKADGCEPPADALLTQVQGLTDRRWRPRRHYRISPSCALFHWLGQEPLARGYQGRLGDYRSGSLLPLQHQAQISNGLSDVFFELRCCLIYEGFVPWLGPGDSHFYMRYTIYPILKGMG